MRGVRFISRKIFEHCIDGGDERRQRRDTGKNRAISDLALDHKGRSLGHLQGVKLCRAGARSRFQFGGPRAFEQFCSVEPSGLRANCRRYLPFANLLSLTHGGAGDRSPDTVVR